MHVVTFSNGAPYALRYDLTELRCLLAVATAAFDLRHDDEALLTVPLDRECGAGPWQNGCVAAFDSLFNVLRVVVAPVDDDEVFETTGNKQFAVPDEPQVPRAQKRPFSGVRKERIERTRGFLGAIPVPSRNVRT
jgi:hypothetical protein